MDTVGMSAKPALAEPLLPTNGAARASHPRVDLLDNAKAMLILCVLLYHTAVVYTSADRPEGIIPFWSGLLAILKLVVMPCFCLISGYLSPAAIDQRRARGLCSLFVTYVCFQVLYYLNLMVSFRLNGFDFDALPVKVFHPDGQAVTSTAQL